MIRTQKIKTKTLQLQNAECGKVITRFPPEPSGYLHLGHVKASLINWQFAQQYNGHMILRFDDTNPQKSTQMYEDAIIRDITTLGITPWKITHTSDSFDVLQSYCELLISKGIFYVDPRDDADIKTERRERKVSPYRDSNIEDNVLRWQQMLAGSQYVVRAKMDPYSNVGCLRDPNMYIDIAPRYHIRK